MPNALQNTLMGQLYEIKWTGLGTECVTNLLFGRRSRIKKSMRVENSAAEIKQNFLKKSRKVAEFRCLSWYILCFSQAFFLNGKFYQESSVF